MTPIESLVLGIIQGLTEFLPVSSSGHLELVKEVFGANLQGRENILFTVSVHLATTLSTLIVFRKSISEKVIGVLKRQKTCITFLYKILISMIPALMVGYFLEDIIFSFYTQNILLVGLMLLFTSFLLILSDSIRVTNKQLTFKKSFLIGLGQAIAILPGISRSGATVTLAVFLNVDRTKATEFSFLMVVPIVIGSMVKLLSDMELSNVSYDLTSLLIGFTSSFLVGIIACRWMLGLVSRSNLKYFGIYCAIIGFTAIVYATY